MRKILVGTIIIALAVPAAAKQSIDGKGWIVHPSPSGHHLNDLVTVGGNTLIGVGRGGVILRSTDGGTSWSEQQSGTTAWMTSVSFSDSSNGWALGGGGGGDILHTTDGGETWAFQLHNYDKLPAADMFMVDSLTGWTIGWADTVMHTTDGGLNWNTVVTGSGGPPMKGVFFANADTGYIVGWFGTIQRTTDGGTTWTYQTSGTSEQLEELYFVHPDTGWAVGANGTILYTEDAGVTWTPQTSNVTNNLTEVKFLDGNTGWAIGSPTILLYTNDGGTTWTDLSFPYYMNDLRGIGFTDASNIWVTGHPGVVLYSNDGGSNWTNQTGLTTQNIRGISVPGVNGWAVGDYGTILKTPDGGTSWVQQTSNTSDHLYDVDFVDVSTGWVAGMNGTILYTSTGGSIWSSQFSGVPYHLLGITFADASTGWAVGSGGVIVHTSDGGTTWEQQTSGTENALQDVQFIDAATGWAVGSAGTILHTVDGGATWLAQNSGTTNNLFSASFVDAEIGTAAGQNGTVLRTVDGGATWTDQTFNTSYHFYAVDFTDASNGTVVGTNTGFHRTFDGGKTWSQVIRWPGQVFRNILFTDDNTGFAVGAWGSIIKTTTGGDLPLTVQMPPLSNGLSGQSIKIPVTYAKHTDGSGNVPVLGFETMILYPDSILHFTGVDTLGFGGTGIMVDTSVTNNSAPGAFPDTLRLSISYQNSPPADTLTMLNFTVGAGSVLGDTASLVFQDIVFNEGFPLATSANGFFWNAATRKIGDANLDGQIQAVDASLILQATIGKVIPDTVQEHTMDVSGNNAIHAYDAALVLRYVAGLISSFPAGSTFVAKPATNGNAAIALETTVGQDEEVILTIRVAQVESVLGADVSLDCGGYAYLGYELPEGLSDFRVAVNETDDARLRIGMASATGLTDDGPLLRVRFRRGAGEPAADAAIRLVQLYLNERPVVGADGLSAAATPYTYDLAQNYPNPFNPSTVIRYQVPEATHVRMVVYDLLGRRIRVLTDAPHAAGRYTATWNGDNQAGFRVASGIYIYRMEAGRFIRTRKMLLLR